MGKGERMDTPEQIKAINATMRGSPEWEYAELTKYQNRVLLWNDLYKWSFRHGETHKANHYAACLRLSAMQAAHLARNGVFIQCN